MKKVGIWIDKRGAKIVSIEKGEEKLDIIDSQVEEYNPKGGSGTKFKGGPQDVVQDSKYLNRENLQFAEYFKNVVERVEDADEIVIFGPAETGEKLHTEIRKNYPILHAKTNPVERADVMTDNQLKAWVRDYYNTEN
ncbi:MAG: hypothetical protein QGH06_04665 [Lutibacter sp.]|nr:hypothetical protein [Lutibacter sp.]